MGMRWHGVAMGFMWWCAVGVWGSILLRKPVASLGLQRVRADMITPSSGSVCWWRRGRSTGAWRGAKFVWLRKLIRALLLSRVVQISGVGALFVSPIMVC